MQRRGLAPWITSTALIISAGVAIAASALLFGGPISEWISDAPQHVAELRPRLHSFASPLEVVQDASSHVDQITSGVTDPDVQRVAMEQLGLLTMAVSNAFSVAATIVVTLALLLLASGDMFHVTLIDAFPRSGDKKRALRIGYGIARCVSRYRSVVTVINLVLAVVIGLRMWAIGMPQSFVWAVMAFFLSFLPDIGPLLRRGWSRRSPSSISIIRGRRFWLRPFT